VDIEGFGDLIRRAQEGDDSAMNSIMDALRPYLLGVAHEYADSLRAVESASDLVQEAELRAWRGLERFCGGTTDEETLAMFRSWMTKIVRNAGLDALRHQGARRRRDPRRRVVSLEERRVGGRGGGAGSDSSGTKGDPPGREPTPSAKLHSAECNERVRRAIAALPDTLSRRIVEMRFFRSLSLRRIADDLNVGYETVKDRYRKAMRRLENDLEGIS